MRLVGLLLLAAGIAIGALWPWAQLNFLGREIYRLEFSGLRGNAPEVKTVVLSETDNPVRMRFQARYEIDGKLPPLNIPVRVRITDWEGPFLDGVISFPTRGIETGPEQEKVRGSTPLNFDVLNSGEHKISLALAPNPNNGGIIVPDIADIEAVFIANAPEITDDYKAFAAVLSLAGIYVLLRSRRRKSAKTPVPPAKWGRGSE